MTWSQIKFIFYRTFGAFLLGESCHFLSNPLIRLRFVTPVTWSETYIVPPALVLTALSFSPFFLQNSMKVMFKCLWKNCGKMLSTAAGIQRHIRTIHLG